MDWQSLYRERLVSAEEAVRAVRDNDRIVTGFGCGEPFAIEKALEEACESYRNVEIVTMITLRESPWHYEHMKGHIKLNCLFASPPTRQGIASGASDYTTSYFHEIPDLLRDYLQPRVAFISVSPPDKHGYVSFGTNVDYIRGACDTAEVVIAQVNQFVPRTFGAGIMHVSEIDYFVEHDAPLPEVGDVALTDVEERIGQYCAELIHDGDCLQLGIGGIPNAVCKQLYDKRDLGLHSELIGDGVVPLLQAGIINNKKKRCHPGKTVIGFAFGTKLLNDYIDDNPTVELMPIDYVNNPNVIATNDNVVSINSCLQIDLLGQVVSDTIGLNQFSGVGGQVDFVRGAAMSRGGRSIIAMPSTAKHGTVSRIVPFITEGGVVTTTRNDIHYIVTEYGCAHLKGKTLKERARALIRIAHPDFRPALCEEFEKRFFEEAF